MKSKNRLNLSLTRKGPDGTVLDDGTALYRVLGGGYGETVETVSDFIFGGSKITADGDCSHEIKRCLFLGRKVMTNLDSIFKSRDIILPCMDVRVGL